MLLPLSEFSSLRSSNDWLPLMTQVLSQMLLALTNLSFFFFIKFKKILLLIYLVVPGLSCSSLDLHSGMWDL